MLDGVLRVEEDGRRLAEYGPGALLGERAALEERQRTSTLVAVTPCRVAAVEARELDRGALQELSKDHRRDAARPELSGCGSHLCGVRGSTPAPATSTCATGATHRAWRSRTTTPQRRSGRR